VVLEGQGRFVLPQLLEQQAEQLHLGVLQKHLAAEAEI
jgi:hypothetical protein